MIIEEYKDFLSFLDTLEVKDVESEKGSLIEKACEFIKNSIESDNYKSPDEESYRMECPSNYFELNMFIEDFKNYLKKR